MILTKVVCDRLDCDDGLRFPQGMKVHQARRLLAREGWTRWNRTMTRRDPCGPVDLCPACSAKMKGGVK
jgi:hypothetical protein